jgi:peptidoglycan/LPS O-acetylase OafA/YrhL
MPNSKGNTLTSPPVLNTVGNPIVGTANIASRKPRRIAALDFTKGALVLIMVLYHWLNYFVRGHDQIYKYLRFLPTSFTFITGFLISQVYLSKYEKSGVQIPKRLIVRGVKLMTIAVFLNLVPSLIHLNALQMRVGEWSLNDFTWAYLTGTRPVAFSVLVPIGYLLILCAGLFFLSKYYRNIYHVVSAALVVCAVACELRNINAGYLQILSIGMLGFSAGCISIDRINKLMERSGAIFVVYCLYLAAITFFVDSFVLQVLGVSISLLVLYWMGMRDAELLGSRRVTILLGRYSLFAYIAQILILQILRWGFHASGIRMKASFAAFVLCIACTILSVEALDRARNRVITMNKIYTAVFG